MSENPAGEPRPAGLLRTLPFVFRVAFRASPVGTVLLFVLEPVGQILGTLGTPIFLKVIADAVIGKDVTRATVGAIGLAVCLAAAYIVFVTGMNLRQTVAERVSHRLDVQLSEITVGITTIEHLERPDYLDRVEALRQEQGLGNVVTSLVFFITTVVQLLAIVVVLAAVHPALAVLPLAGLVSFFLVRRSQRRELILEHQSATMARLGRHLFDIGTDATAGQELRVLEIRAEIARRHRETWQARLRARLRTHAVNDAEGLLGDVVTVGAYLLAVLFTIRLAFDERATPGDVVLVLMLSNVVSGTISEVIRQTNSLASSLRHGARFLWLLDYGSQQLAAEARATDEPPQVLRDGIALSDVWFRYPGAQDWILQGVDLNLPAGSVVALVGENGAGKTTLVKLLLRLYQPTQGQIQIDGIDLLKMDPCAWRGSVTAAFQDFVRFEFPARESIGVGDLEHIGSQETVEGAVVRAGATRAVDSLPNGLDTQLAARWNGGHEPSGGQWQQLALARGLMRSQPLMLLFDEPTSALDAETEHRLFERFTAAARRDAGGGSVTLFVSHRFSTVRSADLIVVLDGGRVVDMGSHMELMSRDGLYAELFRIQSDSYL